MKTLSLLVGAVALVGASSANAAVSFDNITGRSITATSSVPNTFMGGAYNLAAGTTNVTGFQVVCYNATGGATPINFIKATVYLWDTVNLGTVSAASPAFSNSLGSSSAIYDFTASGGLATGFYSALTMNLASAIALADTQVGVTVNFQASADGVNFTSVSKLTTVITYGAAPAVGSNVFNGYYRNAGTPSETDGNFTSALRALAVADQSVALQIMSSDVPAPGALALLGVAGLVGGRRRRS
jgi:MYXO-CTERM domain-containing protein